MICPPGIGGGSQLPHDEPARLRVYALAVLQQVTHAAHGCPTESRSLHWGDRWNGERFFFFFKGKKDTDIFFAIWGAGNIVE